MELAIGFAGAKQWMEKVICDSNFPNSCQHKADDLGSVVDALTPLRHLTFLKGLAPEACGFSLF
jgi:hypothetical protein